MEKGEAIAGCSSAFYTKKRARPPLCQAQCSSGAAALAGAQRPSGDGRLGQCWLPVPRLGSSAGTTCLGTGLALRLGGSQPATLWTLAGGAERPGAQRYHLAWRQVADGRTFQADVAPPQVASASERHGPLRVSSPSSDGLIAQYLLAALLCRLPVVTE